MVTSTSPLPLDASLPISQEALDIIESEVRTLMNTYSRTPFRRILVNAVQRAAQGDPKAQALIKPFVDNGYVILKELPKVDYMTYDNRKRDAEGKLLTLADRVRRTRE
jgi:hypothetical protein